jgi:nucleotide-binding universal stress UspA family protein
MIATSAPVASFADVGAPRVFNNILVAVRAGAAGTQAIEIAARFAARGSAQVKVIHLQERNSYPSKTGVAVELESYQDAVSFTARMKAELRELGVDAQASVGREISGKEAEQILKAAADFGADLIIIGNKRKSALGALLSGSTTRNIVSKSDVPILLVPDKKAA